MKKRTQILIVLTAIVIRCIVAIPIFSDDSRMLQHDSPSYLKVATNMQAGNGYSNCPTAPFYKDVLRTPSYPSFLAGIKTISKDLRAIFFAQLFIDILSLLMIFRIGQQLFGYREAIWAAGFYSISMVTVVMTTQVLAETLFVFFLVASMYFITCGNGTKKYCFAGALMAIAILCKPIALYLGLIFPILFLVEERRGLNIFFYLAPLLLLVGSWMIRNKNITGKTSISSISAYSLYAYNANAVLAKEMGIAESILREERLNALYKNTDGQLADYSGKYDYIPKFQQEGLQILTDNIFSYSQIHLKSTFISLAPAMNYVQRLFGKEKGGRNTISVLRKEGLIVAIKHYFDGRWTSMLVLGPWVLCWLCFLLLAFMGITRHFFRKEWQLILLLAVPVLYFLLIPGPTAEPRFAAPMVPFLALFAGKEVVDYLKKKKTATFQQK